MHILAYLKSFKSLHLEGALLQMDGKRITDRTIQRWVHEARERAGIKEVFACHALRHGGAHEGAKKGMSLKEIGLKLGHSNMNPRAAMQYLIYSDEEQIAVLKKYMATPSRIIRV